MNEIDNITLVHSSLKSKSPLGTTVILYSLSLSLNVLRFLTDSKPTLIIRVLRILESDKDG